MNGWENILLRRVLLLNTAPFVVRGTGGLPLQVAVGASLFIFTAIVFFQQCYQWPKAHLVFCLTSAMSIRIVSMNRKVSTTSLEFFLF